MHVLFDSPKAVSLVSFEMITFMYFQKGILLFRSSTRYSAYSYNSELRGFFTLSTCIDDWKGIVFELYWRFSCEKYSNSAGFFIKLFKNLEVVVVHRWCLPRIGKYTRRDWHDSCLDYPALLEDSSQVYWQWFSCFLPFTSFLIYCLHLLSFLYLLRGHWYQTLVVSWVWANGTTVSIGEAFFEIYEIVLRTW